MSFQESSESIKSRFYLQKNKKALVMGSAVLLVLIALLGAFSFIASSQQGEFSIQKADNEQTAQASEHQEKHPGTELWHHLRLFEGWISVSHLAQIGRAHV